MAQLSSDITRPVPHGLAEWKHCPRCAGDLRAEQSEPDAQPHLECQQCGAHWYANPKPTASCLVERPNGQLLLVRRGIQPFRGCWDVPGGFIEEGEGPEEGALRELEEETGLRGTIVGIAGVLPDSYGDAHASTLNVFYRVLVTDETGAAPASDVDELRWFDRGSLPGDDEIAFECVPRAIAAWREQASAGASRA